MNNFWNERFAVEEYVYGTEPNQFFKKQMEKLQPGKLLLPGEGEGRNAVFAAKSGWDVTAFDSSIVGKRKAEKLARQNKVKIKYIVSDYEDIRFNEDEFDAIGLIYTHMPPHKRNEYHKKLVSFLKPGGSLILEGFSKNQLSYNTGGPQNVDMLFSTTEMESDFESMTIMKILEKEIDFSEGIFHQGIASVIRVTGIK